MTSLSTVTVYLVDDEPSVLVGYARVVRSAGMRVRTFASIEELLEADLSDENACVVSDVRMGGLSGVELPGLLEGRGWHMPVILVTARDTPETRGRARSAGAAAYFQKPLDDRALIDAIAWAMVGHGA